MAITHKITWSLQSQGNNVLAGSQTEAGSLQPIGDIAVPGGAVAQHATVALVLTGLQDVFLVSDKAVTLKTNGRDEIQTVTLTGSPTGGTFTLTFGAGTTAGLAWNATAALVQAALEAIGSIGAGNVACAGGPLPGAAVSVTFQAALGETNVAALTGSVASLTGGSPGLTIATPTPGVAPTDTIVLVAGSPLVWSCSQSYFACPFTTDVTSLSLSNAGSATARVQFYALSN